MRRFWVHRAVGRLGSCLACFPYLLDLRFAGRALVPAELKAELLDRIRTFAEKENL